MRWRPNSIILYAFDIMHLNGRDLRRLPLSERRSILKALVRNDDQSRIQFSDEFHGDGAAFFKACAERELEGIVSKLATSRYVSGRTKTWLKTKCFTEGEFLLVGIGGVRQLLATRNFVFLMRRALLRRPMAMCGFGPNASHRKNWMRWIQIKH